MDKKTNDSYLGFMTLENGRFVAPNWLIATADAASFITAKVQVAQSQSYCYIFFILLHRRERENSFYVLLIIPKKFLRTLNANFVPILFYNFTSKSREFTWFIFF